MLSFSRGRPIVRVNGGKHDGQMIYIYDPSQKCCDKCGDGCKKKKCCDKCEVKTGGCGALHGGSKSKKKMEEDLEDLEDQDETEEDYDYDNPDYDYDPYDYLDGGFIEGRRDGHNMGFGPREELRQALKNKKPPVRSKLAKKMYDETKDIVGGRLKKEIHIDDGNFQILPRMEKNQVENLYIGAPSGAGKSTFTKNYAEVYQKIHPKNPIYIFTRATDPDPAFKNLKCKYIRLTDKILEKPIDALKTLYDSLCIFDDIDTFRDKNITKAVRSLRDDILQTGRKANISTISTSHQVLNYKSTREVLNESQCVVLFPKGGGFHAINSFLKEYCGLSKEQIQRIVKLPSRWVCIYKTYPMYVCYEHGVYLM